MQPPPLPTRDGVRGDLPAPFARSRLDECSPSFALTGDGPVVSCDAWGERRLAVPDGDGWRPVTPAGRWYREPRWAGGTLLAHRDDDAGGRLEVLNTRHGGTPLAPSRLGTVTGWDGVRVARRSAGGEATALGPDGDVVGVRRRVDGSGSLTWARVRLDLPASVLVQDVGIARDGRRMLVTTRGPHGVHARCYDADGRLVGAPLTEPVIGAGAWADGTRVALTVSRWPAVWPYLWDTATGELVRMTAATCGVCETVQANDSVLGHTWSSVDRPRHLRLGDPDHVTVAGGREPVGVSTRILRGAAGPLPCVVQEPDGRARGTVVLFTDGPGGAQFASWSATVESLCLAGWRVVRPNVRGNVLRDPGLDPGRPTTYGVQDVADAATVLHSFGYDRLVVGGTGYGGYLAVRAAAATCVDVDGVFLISGFFQFADLWSSDDPCTRSFLQTPRVDAALDDKPDPLRHYLVIHGERDVRAPLAAVRQQLDRLPDAELVVAPGVGHRLCADTGALAVGARLFEWLDQL
jgi:pimeloyl-ACP methyl ester carboxylesterase